MHESNMIANLLHKIEDIAKAEGADRVTGVHVRIGVLAGISADHFREHWENESDGSLAADALLTVTLDPDPTAADAQRIRLESIDVEE